MGGMRGGRQQDVDNKSLYTALGLEPGAGDNEIKKAYRKMAMKHHPDKGAGALLFTCNRVFIVHPSKACVHACDNSALFPAIIYVEGVLYINCGDSG